ncbi:MAG: BTAD domain-containing putative transcriptional regulator [Actinophytocola sp.]|uniref:AfsR/SARP family transcriptional regulator n=1 Tax=Actinophytocola sp. TaxID=1872138 RepID=UPI003C761BC2
MLGILGTTALLLDGGPDDSWGRPRERAVLATLLVHANEVVPVEELARWVWPADKPVSLQPRQIFETYVARVRRTLARLPAPPALRAEGDGYRLVVEPARVDFHLFRELLAEARTLTAEDPRRVVDLVEGALWLWRGLPLADLTTEPALAWRDRVLHEEWLGAHTMRVRALFDLGQYEEALAALDELLNDFPNDEHLVHLTLTGLYRRHRLAEATRFFLRAWHRLRAEGDGRAARQLRRHHLALAAAQPAPAVPQPTMVPRGLPSEVPDFVGRRAELVVLDDAAARRSGVVVLEGPGGVGKTALAVHWAHRVRNRFTDGDLFVDVRGGSAVDDILTAVGQPPEQTLSRRKRERLLALLTAGRRMLVVLDDVRDAGQVRRLIELMPSCFLVVTGRQRLSLPGVDVRRVAVPPMSDDCGIALLSLRAPGRVRNTTGLGALCGGLPLLLDVLAGQLTGAPSTQLDELTARMDRRRRLAVVGEHGQRTSPGESCLTWAYHSLAAPERRLFRLLALHPGTDIAIEAACACDGRTTAETLVSITHLMAARLIRPTESLDRFGRHEVLREFAARCLERDEPEDDRRAAHVRLLDHFIGLTTRAARMVCTGAEPAPDQAGDGAARFADAEEAIAWFTRERLALPAVVRQAYDAGCHVQTWLLADPLARLVEWFGGGADSTEIRAFALEAVRAVGADEAPALHHLGVAHLMAGHQDAARRCLEAALRMPLDDHLHVSVADRLGRLAASRGDTAEAYTLCHRAAVIAERLGAVGDLAWLHCRMGQALHAGERLEDALVHLRRARTLARQDGARAAEVASLVELAAVHRELGDHRAALTHCEDALAVAEEIPDLQAAARICVAMAELGRECRLFDDAVSYARRGVATLQGTQDLAAQAGVVEALGDALHHSGEPHEAVVTWREAADLYGFAGLSAMTARLRGKMDLGRVGGTVPPARAGSLAPGGIERSLPPVPHTFNGHADG